MAASADTAAIAVVITKRRFSVRAFKEGWSMNPDKRLYVAILAVNVVNLCVQVILLLR